MPNRRRPAASSPQQRPAPAPLPPARRAHAWLERMGVPRRPLLAGQWAALLSADPPLAAAFDALPAEDESPWDSQEDHRRIRGQTDAASLEFNKVLWSTRQRSLVGYLRDFDRAVAHAWLPWWAQHAPAARRLADVGAGPGLLAAGYAALRADLTEVVAVEPDPSAAPVTAAWAEVADVADRVRSVQAELADLSAERLGGVVDQVVLTRVLANIANWDRDAAGDALDSPTEVREGWRSSVAADLARQLRPLPGCLSAGGTLLTYEKITSGTGVGVYASAVQAAGFGLDLAASDVSTVQDEQMLRLVARPGADPVHVEDVIAWAAADPRIEYIGGWALERDRDRLGPPTWWGRVRYPEQHGGGVHRIEVITTDQGGWVWQTTSKRFRDLEPVPPADIQARVDQWQEYLTGCRRQGCAVRSSDTG